MDNVFGTLQLGVGGGEGAGGFTSNIGGNMGYSNIARDFTISIPEVEYFDAEAEVVDNEDGTVDLPLADADEKLEAGQLVTVAGTENYDGLYYLVAVSATAITVTAAYEEEELAGDETCQLTKTLAFSNYNGLAITPESIVMGGIVRLKDDGTYENIPLETFHVFSACVAETGEIYLQLDSADTAFDATDTFTVVIGGPDRSILTQLQSYTGVDVYSNAKGDFTATITDSTKDVVIAGYRYTFTAVNVMGAIKTDSAGNTSFVSPAGVTVASTTITFTGQQSNFVTGDVVVVLLRGPDRTRDLLQATTNVTGLGTYCNSKGDFTATPTAASKQIEVVGWAHTLEAIHVRGALRISSAGAVSVIPTTNVVVSGTTLTLGDMATNFSAGDSAVLWLQGPDQSIDKSIDAQKTIVLNPLTGQWSAPVRVFSTVATTTSSSPIYVADRATVLLRYETSNTAALHGAILVFVSYDNGTTFEGHSDTWGAIPLNNIATARPHMSVPVTRNRTGLCRIDVAGFTHIGIVYHEIVDTAGTLTLDLQTSWAELSSLQTGRSPVSVHGLYDGAGAVTRLLTSSYVDGPALDCRGYDYAKIDYITSGGVAGCKAEGKFYTTSSRGGTYTVVSAIGVPTPVAGADTVAQIQPAVFTHQPLVITDGASFVLELNGVYQLRGSFKDSSGVDPLCTLEVVVTLFNRG